MANIITVNVTVTCLPEHVGIDSTPAYRVLPSGKRVVTLRDTPRNLCSWLHTRVRAAEVGSFHPELPCVRCKRTRLWES